MYSSELHMIKHDQHQMKNYYTPYSVSLSPIFFVRASWSAKLHLARNLELRFANKRATLLTGES